MKHNVIPPSVRSVRQASLSRMGLSAALMFVLLFSLATPALADEDPPAFLDKWGSWGEADGEFKSPQGVAVDAEGNVFVADADMQRIQKFAYNPVTGHYEHELTWGSGGGGDGQFASLGGIAVDSSGNVYVADEWNHRIQVFDNDGVFIRKWGIGNLSDGGFDRPWGVAVDSDGKVYVADTYHDRIQKFENDGTFLTKWGTEGDDDGEFNGPTGIAVDEDGYVYIADQGNSRMQKFSFNPGDGTYSHCLSWGSSGQGDGQFDTPWQVSIDDDGDLYVVEQYNNRVQKFDSSGGFLTKWGSNGSDDGQFGGPHGVAAGAEGKVFVGDTYENRIQVFGPRTTVDIDISLKVGWNMVSVPVEADDMSTAAVFPDVDAVYTWNPIGKSYTVPTTIESEKGYWVAVDSDRTISVTGAPVTDWTDGVSTGWNMIGSVHGGSVNFSAPDDDPDGSVEGFVYWWHPTTKSYVYGTSVETGKGYWAASTSGCDLTLGPPPP